MVILKVTKLIDSIDLAIYQRIPLLENTFLKVISETASIYVSGFILLLYIALFLNFHRDYIKNKIITKYIFGFILLNIVIGLLKLALSSPRPSTDIVFNRPFELSMISEYGFPSGHTGRASFLAGLVKTDNNILKIALIIYAIVIGLSRLLLGVHWTSDVLAGFLIGFYIGEKTRVVIKH